MDDVRRAAAVMLTRGEGSALRVFLVKRDPKLRFFGGYWAFPGGRVEPEESSIECAVRELREEVAIDLRDHAHLMREICTITTPEFSPLRYETLFYYAHLPAGFEPEVQAGELTEGRFVRPRDAIEAWRRAELRIVPPTLFLLEYLREGDVAAFLRAARREARALESGKLHPIRFSPGIFLAPLKSHTHPPAMTTNCLLVGEQHVYVVDPGARESSEYPPLFELMDAWSRAGRQFMGILLTHDHPDHTAGVPLVARRYGLDVLAHPLTLKRLSIPDASTRALNEGDTLHLGVAPDGSENWRLEVWHTPGHAPGHLAFWESRYGALIAGDLCSSVSTVVIDPPDGHLATYLQSLERILEKPPSTLYPGHGPAHRDGAALIRHYLKHRAGREAALLEALSHEPRTPEELVPVVYADTEPALYPLASRSLLAGLIKLSEEGRAHAEGEGWVRDV